MAELIRATDLYTLTECNRKVFLSHHGNRRNQIAPGAYDQWIQGQGEDFEAQVISKYRVHTPRYRSGRLEAGFDATLELMKKGVEYIYQGVLIDGDLIGIPDLLERVDGGGSRLGGYSYRPIDVKYASSPRLGHRLQVMAYIALLEALQGVRTDGGLFLRLSADERTDDRIYREEKVAFDAQLFNEKYAEVLELVSHRFDPSPFISSTCQTCTWRDLCVPMAEQTQDASLMSGLRRTVWTALHERGIGTLPAVARAAPEELINIRGVGEKTANSITWQAQALTENRSIQIGTPNVPVSDPVIFFDVESVPSDGVIYLMGTFIRERRREKFVYDVAKHPDEERHMWLDFVHRMDRLDGYIYHYGSYEVAALRKLMERYNPDDERVLAMFDRMIDLQKVIKHNVVLPLRGYSLKDVGPWLGYEWGGETQAADDSILEYLTYLETGRQRHLRNVLQYNEDDCRATAHIYDWLLTLPAVK